MPPGRDGRGPNNQRKTTTMTQNKQPALVAYSVEDARKGRKAYWTKIGRLFAHDDSKGFDLVLNALPINGRIVIRQEQPCGDADADQAE